ncbi:MAG TPA: hypothetical protein VEC36_13805 [Patescibacteria group bacterium]|nr:hypothetical protein [Patescibacteria group bacterium]
MGFEFKILLRESDLSDEALKEVVSKLENQKKFTQDWPEFTLALESDGIYICKNIESSLWTSLEELQEFLLLKGIHHKVQEL